MFKIAIVGCENSHANGFLDVIRDEKLDVQVLGVHSPFEGAAEKLAEKYGVPVMENYDSLVGQLDGLIVTARHGDNHYKFAKPYLNDNIPIYIDKPITVSEEDAREFCAVLKEKKIPVCGGSVLKHAAKVKELKALVESGEKGQVLGGFLRAPLSMHNEHGGFFFYSQHLVQTMCEIFGYYPKAVRACATEKSVSCVFRYDGFDVVGQYLDRSFVYSATVNFSECAEGGVFDLEGVTPPEFHEYYDLLKGEPQQQSYEDLFQPVFILNATYRAIESGKEEPIGTI